jgi:two-component system phosphate regulon sensor histidine kinase PhoR
LFEEAETHKQHLEATLELTANPILITDEDNRLVLLNQQARALLDLSANAVGRPVGEVIKETSLRDVLISQGERYEEVSLEDGTTWEVRGTKILDNGRILTMQNITSLRELERVKEHFVATVSHDMRSPLNAVIGFADALAVVGPLNQKQQQFTNRITKSAEFMLSIVNGLLELARVDTLQQTYQPCALEQLVRSVASEYQDRAERKEIDLIIEIESAPPISGDPNQLRSAISNLVDNALKYTPQGETVRLSLSRTNDKVQLLVSDRGSGIPATELNRIFDKFYRSQNTQNEPGIGLGLALVRSIAKAHGGDVWAESDGPGKGSAFYLQFPLTITSA